MITPMMSRKKSESRGIMTRTRMTPPPTPDEFAEECGFNLDTAICELDGSEECLLCPFRQAIGDVGA